MSKSELVEQLKRLSDSADTESAHGEADDLLLAFIDDAEVKDAYNSVPKWYA